MKNHNGKNGIKWLIYLVLWGFLIKFFRFVFFVFKGDNEKKIWRNIKDFFTKEKKEIKELVGGEESFGEYCEDSGSIFKNYFIPNDRNDFKPKILRTKPLAIIAITLLFFKISVAGYLFFIYPNLAKMSEVIQNEVYSLINIDRRDNNVATLSINNKLNEVAKRKAEDMINKNYFAHKSPDGKMIWDTINRNEYPYLYVGENLAMNFTSAQSVNKALMSSVSHKKNILNPKYSDVGVAVVAGEINGKKTNVLVEVFAYPKPAKTVLAMSAAPKKEILPAKEKEKPSVKPIKPAPAAVVKTKPAVKPIASAVNNAKPAVKPSTAKSLVLAAENQIGNNKIFGKTKEAAIKEVKDKEIINQSPNKELEAAAPVEAVIEVPREYTSAAKVINYSQYIFIGALILLISLLLVNILVRASIQHKPIIFQTFLLIIFVYGMVAIKFNFLQYITEKILIL